MPYQPLTIWARYLAQRLREHNAQIVFAESCTGGLIAASLATIPGISRFLCGSAVVYQIETKAEWLGIARSLLDDPGPVSREVAEAMARGVLERTPQARLAAAVTGHLGPDAPPEQDGLVYAAVALRTGELSTDVGVCIEERHLQATAPDDATDTADSLRIRRQREAAAFVLSLVCTVLGEGLDGHRVTT